MKLMTLLTKKQAEVFKQAIQGYSQSEMAEKLRVSASKVYDKLEVRNTVEAVRECMLHGLLKVEDLERRP